MNDLISRQAAIDMAVSIPMFGRDVKMVAVGEIKNLPSAQLEITEEQAIEHLQSTGWMQNHDREMYDMGLKKQLADDSGSYDSLLPSAQPEIIRCKDCEYGDQDEVGRWFCTSLGCQIGDDDGSGFCADAERRTE